MAYRKEYNKSGTGWTTYYDEDEYMESIKEYEGTAYYDALKNNPYLTDMNSYHANWWEETFAEGFFNDYSRRENWYAEMARQRDQYKAEILKQIAADKYNSPAEAVKRDQAAGLNPDLNGGPSGVGATSAPPQDETPPPVPGADAPGPGSLLSATGAVGSFMTNLLDGCMRFYGMFQQFRSKDLENGLKELELYNGTFTAERDRKVALQKFKMPELKEKVEGLGYHLSEDGHTVLDKDGKPVTGEGIAADDVLTQVFDTIDAAVVSPTVTDGKTSGKNPIFKNKSLNRFSKQARAALTDDTAAITKDRTKMLSDILSAHEQSAEVLGSGFYAPNIEEMGRNMADFNERVELRMRELETQLKAAQTRIAENQADYSDEYYEKDENGNVVIGESDREREIAENALAKAIASIDAIVDEEVDNWNQSLKEKNTWWATGLRMLLPQTRNVLKENYMQDFMQKFNFGKGVGSANNAGRTKTAGGASTTKQLK